MSKKTLSTKQLRRGMSRSRERIRKLEKQKKDIQKKLTHERNVLRALNATLKVTLRENAKK